MSWDGKEDLRVERLHKTRLLALPPVPPPAQTVLVSKLLVGERWAKSAVVGCQNDFLVPLELSRDHISNGARANVCRQLWDVWWVGREGRKIPLLSS